MAQGAVVVLTLLVLGLLVPGVMVRAAPPGAVIWKSKSGRTPPRKKAPATKAVPKAPKQAKDLSLEYILKVQKPEVDAQKAAQLHARVMPASMEPSPGSRGLILHGGGGSLGHRVTVIARAAHVAMRLLSVEPEMNATIFTNKAAFNAWALQRLEKSGPTATIRPFTSVVFYEDMELPDLLPPPEGSTWSLLRRFKAKRFYQQKIAAMQLSPYERTLYLDPDTCTCGSKAEVDRLFGMLDEYDIALALDKDGILADDTDIHVYAKDIPAKFPERYWGAALYRKTPATLRLLDSAMELFTIGANMNFGHRNEQEAAREALYLAKGKLTETVLTATKDLCRVTSNEKKRSCGKRQPKCLSGSCLLVQDRCECWSQQRNKAVQQLHGHRLKAPIQRFPLIDL